MNFLVFVNLKTSKIKKQDEDETGPSRGSKKRGRTSESKRTPKKARQEDVDALMEEQRQTEDEIKKAKTVKVSAAQGLV